MPKLTGKQWLYVGAGVLALFLAYRWYQSRQGQASTDTTGTVSSGSGSDYGQLAGQEQGDVAALSGQEASDIAGIQSGLASATGQEQADIGNVNAQIAAATGQEQTDIGTLQGQVTDLAANTLTPSTIGGQFNTLFPAASKQIAAQTKTISTLQHELAKIMAGEKKQGGKSTTHGKPASQHAKTGGNTKSKGRSSSPHTNAHHPTGTARHSVAPRSHAPKRGH